MKKDIRILRNALKKEEDARVFKRILMVLYLFRGETARKTSEVLDCTHPLVLYWKKRYVKEGIEGLKTRPRSGKPRAISRRQESDIKKVFSNRGSDNPLTTKQAHSLVFKKSGVSYSKRQVTRILHRWDFHLSAGRPSYWNRASEEEIKKFWKKNLLPQKEISRTRPIL